MPATDQFTGNLKTLYVRTRVNVGEYDERDDFVMATAEQVKAHCASCVDHAASIHPVAETVPWAAMITPQSLMDQALLHAVASLYPDAENKLGLTPGNIADLQVVLTINGVAVPLGEWFRLLDENMDRQIAMRALALLEGKLSAGLEDSIEKVNCVVKDFEREIFTICFPNGKPR